MGPWVTAGAGAAGAFAGCTASALAWTGSAAFSGVAGAVAFGGSASDAAAGAFADCRASGLAWTSSAVFSGAAGAVSFGDSASDADAATAGLVLLRL